MNIRTKEITRASWPHIETLFGNNGACGGCWCQAWRIARGEHWDEIKGKTARGRLRRGIRGGTVHGILAFVGRTPVGWCTFGPRESFDRLNRAPSLRCSDAARVWSVPCFFVQRTYRGKGVAKALLAHALRSMRKRRVEIVEGYPVKPNSDGTYIAAFSWTGTRSLFRKEGFTLAGNRGGGKERVRKNLHPASKA